MTDVSISPVGRSNVDICAGRGHAATGLAGWLGLASRADLRTHGAVDRLFHRPAGHALHGVPKADSCSAEKGNRYSVTSSDLAICST
jgi:hypothetical protein